MNTVTALHLNALQRFEPDRDAIYTIDSAAHLAGMPRHQILVCCKHGLVSPLIDQDYGTYLFDTQAIRTLQRIRYLHQECGINLPGIQMILQLMEEVERLRTAARYTDYF
jgi:DNA-binding transcriptional MerR regulator